MALEVYYPIDIHNALLAAKQAVNATAAASGGQEETFAQGYLVGYRAALTTLALAFGLVTWAEFPLHNDTDFITRTSLLTPATQRTTRPRPKPQTKT